MPPHLRSRPTSPVPPAAALTAAVVMLVSACGAGSSGAGSSNASARATATSAASSAPASVDTSMRDLEQQYDVRLGVHAVDAGSGRTVSWRADERFAFASTIKAPLAGAVLEQLGDDGLDDVVRYGASDLVPYSPVTEQHVDDGMTVGELLDASLRFSDNTAANLLYDVVGGPEELDRALDAWGDDVTDPERTEPDLNTAVPGDTRDTTTPRAMTRTLRDLVLGDVLAPADRELLRSTMVANTTGDALVRAGVPDGWTVADKTGSADYGVRNDVAVVYPTDGAPLVLAVFSTGDEVDDEYDDALVADATRVAVDALRASS